MKNLLHVVHYPVFGGPHNQALRLAGPLRQHDWNTIVLLPDEPGNAASRLHEGGIDVETLSLARLRASKNPLSQARYLAALAPDVRHIRALIRRRAIDLVVVAGLVNPQAAIAARLEGVPVVWQLLDTRAPAVLVRLLMPLVVRLADSVMTTGRGLARFHPGIESLESRLHPFYPPVDCDTFKPRPRARAGVRKGWGLGKDDLVLGCVGNINPQKGIEYLIEALALLKRRLPLARLVLIGAEYPGHRDYSLELRASMQRLGLTEGRDVIFTGFSDHVEELMAGVDICLLAAAPRSEGVPTGLLEAMASGVPVVATNVGAVKEAVPQGEVGFVVLPEQPARLAQAVESINLPGVRADMARQAREHALRYFDIDACVTAHLQAFDKALAHRQTRSQARGVTGRQVTQGDETRDVA